MKVSIFGMGYVGAVCTACLADRGHYIIGVDVVPGKVEMINSGRSPIVEPGLQELLQKGVQRGVVSATSSARDGVFNSEISFIAVPTPSRPNGDLNLDYVVTVCREIGQAIKEKGQYHSIVIRSTVLPGSVMKTVLPVLEEATGLRGGEGFGLAVNPEFLRESTAIDDYNNPPMTVVGCYDEISARQLRQLYGDLQAPMLVTSIETAEMVKYTCNAWHAVKVAFANEIGSIAKASGVDGREVMDIFCLDKRLNISSYYLKPGFAFGGSCLPKDVRALCYRASSLNVKHPLLGSVMESNENHVKNSFNLIEQAGKKKVGFLGLSFKAGTDDLREAPQVELIEKLLGKGYHIKVYDANVSYAKVHGSNKQYIESRIPHISSLLHDDLNEVINDSEFIVIGNGDHEFAGVFDKLNNEHHLLDLNGLMTAKSNERHQGICW